VDVLVLTSPPHFRPRHLDFAVSQNKHCFVEKPIAVDVPGVRKVEEICTRAEQKGLSIVSGLCWRYDKGVNATMDKIAGGAIGDIVAIQSTYNGGTIWYRRRTPAWGWSPMEERIRNWYYHTWLSGDHIVEQAVHSIDKTAWLMGDAHPIRAFGMGGRQQRVDEKYGNIYDHYTVFYEYDNGVKVFFTCRQQDNWSSKVDELVLGTEGQAEVLAHRIWGKEKWRYRGPKPSMYRVEHEELFKSIRNGSPINNGHYMCNSTMIAIMGRACTYTGLELTWDKFSQSTERLGPDSYDWGDAPESQVAIPGVTQFS
jgi:predicted dehydrogenase